MTNYYICRASDMTDLNVSQNNNEQLACEITKAARIYDEITTELVAIDANSENGMYAQLKGAALYSMELDSSGIELWESYGRKIFEYLLAPTEEFSRLWAAFSPLSIAIGEYEQVCGESSVFEELAAGFAESVEMQLDDNIREEQNTFANIMEDVYQIDELKEA